MYSIYTQLFIKSTTEIATGTTSDGVNADTIADEDNDVTVEREAIANHMIRPISSSNTKVGMGKTWVQNRPHDFESHPILLQVVAVQGLRKEFKTNEGAKSKKSCFERGADDAGKKEEKIKVAVRNLSLGVEEGEVR